MDFSIHWRVSKEEQNVSRNNLKDFFSSKITVKEKVKNNQLTKTHLFYRKKKFLHSELF